MTPSEYARLLALVNRLNAWMASEDRDALRVIVDTRDELQELVASGPSERQITLVVDAGSSCSDGVE